MENIEIRAWHKKRKKYYSVHHLHCGTIGYHPGDWATCKARNCIENKDIYIQIQPKDVILELYSGLTDRNRRKIFEGDRDSRFREVVYENGCFYLKSRSGKKVFLYLVCKQLEIIGHRN